MSVEDCIGVTDCGTGYDSFNKVQWCDSIELNYNPPYKSTYEQIDPAAIHIVQKRQKSQTFTSMSMLPEDTEGKVIGPTIDVKCKIDTVAGANRMPISTFRKLCPAVFGSVENPLRNSVQFG